jgi:two-component system response regulator
MGGLKRILLAEDSPEDVELTLSALSEHRLANEVITVGDGAEALDYLYKRGRYTGRAGGLPSFVLLDIKMPKVDGLEVLRRIRSDPQMATLPVVMLTSSREESDIIESYKHHVNAYVVKPVAFPDFVEAIKNLGLFWAVLNEPPPGSARKAA